VQIELPTAEQEHVDVHEQTGLHSPDPEGVVDLGGVVVYVVVGTEPIGPSLVSAGSVVVAWGAPTHETRSCKTES
jgi:hypothetical protein